MRRIIAWVVSFAVVFGFVSMLFAQEQQPGEPLYFNREDVKEHESDLAPETDPHWQQEKARYQREGRPVEEMYDNPTESIYESTTSIKRTDGGDDSSEEDSKPPSRWGN